MWIYLFKKPGDFRLNRDILNLQKIGIRAISLLFESVSSSIEIFWGGRFSFNGYLMPEYSFSSMLFGGDLQKIVFLQKI